MIELNGLLVSELSDITSIDGSELCSDSLFLISQKIDDYKTESGYISRKMKYGQLLQKINSDSGIYGLSSEVKNIGQIVETSSVLSCKLQHPYILSSYVFKNGGLISADGYPLSLGMDIVFKNVVFDAISCNSICSNVTTKWDGGVVNGNTTFNSNVALNGETTIGTSYIRPIKDNQIATKKYVDEECSKAGGTVKSVNKISPDNNGNIDLTCYRCETFNFYTKDNPDTPIPYKIMLSAD